MAGFNEEKFRSDEADMRKELRKYNLHKDAKFMTAFDGYMDQLHNNGMWLNQGNKPNDQWSGDAANNLIAEFDRINALHVPASWWRENRKEKDFAKMRDAKAQETFSKKYLWSKTEPFYPAKQAAKAGGLILETSPPERSSTGRTAGSRTGRTLRYRPTFGSTCPATTSTARGDRSRRWCSKASWPTAC